MLFRRPSERGKTTKQRTKNENERSNNTNNHHTCLMNDRGACLAVDDGVCSNRSISCCYLRCAADVIARTKSNDCVRVYHFDAGDSHQSAPPLASASKLGPIKNALPSSSMPCTNLLGENRLQRRKEKKRRKKEIRMHAKEQDLSTRQSLRITTTKFHPVSSSMQNGFAQMSTSSVPHSMYHPTSIVHVKPLIVLDLNGILCHRVRRTNKATTPSKSSIFRPSCGNISNTDVIPRSDLHDFLTLLHENFCLAVWTSATRKTAKLLVQALFPDEIRERLLFIWHRNYCSLVTRCGLGRVTGGDGMSAHDNQRSTSDDAFPVLPEFLSASVDLHAPGLIARNNSSFCVAQVIEETNDSHESGSAPSGEIIHDDITAVKSLSKVWTAYPLWDTTNTILLDDSPEKCPDRYRGNALHPLPITGTVTACVTEEKNLAETKKMAGAAKNPSDDLKPGEGSYSIVDDDEENQTVQRNFFRLLACYWEQSASSPRQTLVEFLNEHANSHSMRWEIPSGTVVKRDWQDIIP
jgi:hypothetical protein